MRVKSLRRRRNSDEVNKELARLQRWFDSGRNVVPFTMPAANAKATTGEMDEVLRSVYGAYHPRALA